MRSRNSVLSRFNAREKTAPWSRQSDANKKELQRNETRILTISKIVMKRRKWSFKEEVIGHCSRNLNMTGYLEHRFVPVSMFSWGGSLSQEFMVDGVPSDIYDERGEELYILSPFSVILGALNLCSDMIARSF